MTNLKPGWYGILTVENIDEMAAYFESFLKGKRHTMVAYNAAHDFGHDPEVRTSQTPLDTAFKVNRSTLELEDGTSIPYASFDLDVSGWCISLSTTAQYHKPDTCSRQPYIVIEHELIRVELWNGYGEKLKWIFALERNITHD